MAIHGDDRFKSVVKSEMGMPDPGIVFEPTITDISHDLQYKQEGGVKLSEFHTNLL